MKLLLSFFRLQVLLILFLGSVNMVYGQEQSPERRNIQLKADSLRKESLGVPVVPFNDTIFYVYSRLGPYTPQDRADNVRRRIREIEEDFAFHPDSIRVIQIENTFDIAYCEDIIMTVTHSDAKLFNLSEEEVAHYYRNAIVDSIQKHREETGIWNILRQIGLVLLVVVVFYLLLKYTNRLFRILDTKVEKQKGKLIKGISIKSYNIMDEDRATKSVLFVVKIIKYAVILLLFYLTLPLLFGIFPETRDIAAKLIGYITSPLASMWRNILKHIPNVITIIVIVTIFRYLIKGVRYFAYEIDRGRLTISGFYSDWAMPTYNIVRTLLYAFMFIVIFPYLPGSGSKVFQGVSVFIGIIFSLGSTSLIGNVVSGLVLTYMRPFMVGDFIKIGDITGTIVEKTPFVTRIRTIKNEDITIPNANVMAAYTTNYTTSAKKKGLIVHKTLTIGYDTPWRKVQELLLLAADKTPYLLKKPAPFVLQTALDDFYANYQINAYTNEDKKLSLIYSELYANIQDVFNEAGIELTSMHYQANRDGNGSTLPKEYLPEGNKPPAPGTERK